MRRFRATCRNEESIEANALGAFDLYCIRGQIHVARPAFQISSRSAVQHKTPQVGRELSRMASRRAGRPSTVAAARTGGSDSAPMSITRPSAPSARSVTGGRGTSQARADDDISTVHYISSSSSDCALSMTVYRRSTRCTKFRRAWQPTVIGHARFYLRYCTSHATH